MGQVSRLGSYGAARLPHAAPPTPLPRRQESTKVHATLDLWALAIVPFGCVPSCRVCGRNLPIRPLVINTLRVHVGRAPCAMRHVLAGGGQPANPHPYSCPCPCSSAPGCTDCRPPVGHAATRPVFGAHDLRTFPPTRGEHICNQQRIFLRRPIGARPSSTV